MFDSTLARKAQADYCKSTGAPHFAPESGICFYCHRDIYEHISHPRWTGIGNYLSGISVEQAGTELITGCPHCSKTYCD